MAWCRFEEAPFLFYGVTYDRVAEVVQQDPAGRFHPDIKWVSCPAFVIPNMLHSDGEYINPDTLIPPPEDALVDTDAALAELESIIIDALLKDLPASERFSFISKTTEAYLFATGTVTTPAFLPLLNTELRIRLPVEPTLTLQGVADSYVDRALYVAKAIGVSSGVTARAREELALIDPTSPTANAEIWEVYKRAEAEIQTFLQDGTVPEGAV